MFILDSNCGWIPDPPIKFAYHLINLIKNLTPVILIIMGSLDFGKAVMAHKDDEIKKAQNAFIKKLIAGAAVFFVIVFAKWIVQILVNAGVSDGNQALSCVNQLLNDKYTPDDKQYYEGPDIKKTTTKNPTNNTTKPIDYEKYDFETCKNTCSDWAKTQAQATLIANNFSAVQQTAMLPSMTAKFKKECIQKCESTNESMISTFPDLFQKQQQETAQCMAAANCTSIENCSACILNNEVERYKYTKKKGAEVCSANRPYANDNTYLDSCMSDFGHNVELSELTTLYNKCSSEQNPTVLIGGDEAKKNCCQKIKPDIDKEIQKEYNNCLETYTKNVKTNLVKWYCDSNPNDC